VNPSHKAIGLQQLTPSSVQADISKALCLADDPQYTATMEKSLQSSTAGRPPPAKAFTGL